MSKPFKNLSIGVVQPEPYELTDQKVSASALVRIADAVESMSSNYVQMQRDLDYYKKANRDQQKTLESRDNVIRSLKGVVTRLKNQRMKQSTRIGTKHLADMETERLAWSLKTFADATPISSLRKLESEIAEIEKNIEGGIKDPEEYADAMMCLLDSAGRDGITVAEILSAFEIKLDKNKLRKWRKNPDDSYSHVKD
ncbi:hypothetical protein ASG33_08135 [Dyadobacter sp. Leaf189]|nr:hypothetical protein ASG33_08135 [Dyadobacter sp. Leaf189]